MTHSSIPSLPLPRLMGHRGARDHAPENTILGIETAKRQGADWVELDVLPSLDGIAILSHDDSLMRCCADSRNIHATSAAQLADVNAAAGEERWSSTLAPQPLPTMTQTLHALADLDMGLNQELKVYPHTDRQALVTGMRQAMADSPMHRLRGFYWSSFDADIMELCQAQAPDVPRGLICEAFNAATIETAQRLGCFAIHPDQATITPELVALANAAGLTVGTWTVNSVERAQYCWNAGVQAVMTDSPMLLHPYAP